MTGNCADLGKAEIFVLFTKWAAIAPGAFYELGRALATLDQPRNSTPNSPSQNCTVSRCWLGEGEANGTSREREKVFSGGEGKVEKEVFLLRRRFLFPLARLKAKAQIWEFKSTQKTAKLGVRNAENSKQALVRLLYPEQFHILSNKVFIERWKGVLK